jgi:taurine--2-oxoglutarate transaminase
MCVNLGHKNEAVIRAIQDQAGRLPYISPAYATDVRAQLSRLLLEVLPSGLDKFFFTTSGTEAIEAAIKIARLVTGRRKIIARYQSYHGSTLGAIALTGDPRRNPAEPASPAQGTVFAPEVNCYRCPIKHQYPACGIACVDYIQHIIENEDNVAGVLVEPIVGTNGVLVPPREYFPRLREICDRHNVLLIGDEVMTGWGRTGEWFALDHWKVSPDILVTAKGITSAYAPLGLCATTSRIASFFEDHFFAHGHTYEAHPLTLAPAVAAISEMRRNRLIERARELGPYLETKLTELTTSHPCIGDVRGLGLFWGMELVRDRRTKEPFNTKADKLGGKVLVIDEVAAEMMRQGVFVQAWLNHFVIAPPLIINKGEIDFATSVMNDALRLADDKRRT